MHDLNYPFDSHEIIHKKKSIKRCLLSNDEQNKVRMQKKIAILGGSTTHDIKLVLELFLLSYGIEPIFYESEYNQFYEDAVFGNKDLDSFHPDLIYICTSNKNIYDYPNIRTSNDQIERMLAVEFEKWKSIWNCLFNKFDCAIIQNNFEKPLYRLLGNMDSYDHRGKTNYLNRLNMRFAEYAEAKSGLYICDIDYLSADYGLSKWSDPVYWHRYKYALSIYAIPTLAFNVANIIKSIFGKSKKGLVLDLDNTLWGGVIGDDGIEGIEIGQETSKGQAFSAFQEYIKNIHDTGVVLAIDSKNDLENALLGINHLDGILKEEDFAVIKANWNPKSDNLIEISKELGVLPDSLVFIDDNPAERLIVEDQIIGISAPPLSDVSYYPLLIDRSGFFERVSISNDDLKRNEMYKDNAKRMQHKMQFSDYSDYLDSLEMHAQINSFEPIYFDRIVQLTNKTNQFNLTTKRYSLPEIEDISSNNSYLTLYGKLSDRFGDNGVISVIIGKIEKNSCFIELWIMSCRVLKRDMEFAMMDELISRCRSVGIRTIYGKYIPTAKNSMVKNLYQELGFLKIEERDDGESNWQLDIDGSYINMNKHIKIERK